MDRKDKVVTELQDRAQEQKINEALKLCGYPEWAFKQVTLQNKPEKTKNKAQPVSQIANREVSWLSFLIKKDFHSESSGFSKNTVSARRLNLTQH